MRFAAIAYERRLARLVKELERRDKYIARGNELLSLCQQSRLEYEAELEETNE